MYYSTNALYDYLDAHPDYRFFFVKSNMWMLVYGNSNCDPLLLVLVSGTGENAKTDLTTNEQFAYDILSDISTASEIPLIFIRFSIYVDQIDSVMIFDEETRCFFRESLDELKSLFMRYGLPISDAHTAKYLNDRSSSAYHNWQRSQLGRSLKVSDIDLINIKDSALFAFYELKRSYISLDVWRPYPDDYPNFVLLSKLACKAGLRFRIAYNVRRTNPWDDDISRIKVFEFRHGSPNIVRDNGIYTLEDFLNL